MMARMISAVVALASQASLAFAASSDGYQAAAVEPQTPWWAYLYAVVALAGICVVGFKNAKRTHLD
jgi:hypothetical protein